MSKAIDVLMTEHRLIERVLGSLETCAIELGRGRSLERARVADYAEFFGRFADACHHGKEEDILFRVMAENGFSKEMGPLAVMLYEHTLNRQHVGALRELGAATGAVTPLDERTLAATAEAFVPLLRQHIVKEDRILYPMAIDMLAPSAFDEIETEFDRFERAFSAGAEVERLHRLAESLERDFPGDPERMAAAAGMGCGAAR